MTTHPPTTPVGLVVVSYGSSALLATHLAGVRWPERVRVVVVDNRSTEEESDRVEQLCRQHGFSFVGLPDNRGFAAGCNAGARRAVDLGCTAVVLLNPDAVATPATVLALADTALERPGDLVGPSVADGPQGPYGVLPRLSLHDGRIRSRPDAPLTRAVPWLGGACVALSADLLDRLGGVPEGYFLYWEDVELSTAVQALGGSVLLREDLFVRHDEGGTHGPREGAGKSALYYRWNTRNRLVYAARNLPRQDVLRWLWATPAVSWEILMRGGRRQLVSDPGLLVAAVRGSLAGAVVAGAAVVGRRPTGATFPRGRRTRGTQPGAGQEGSDRTARRLVVAMLTYQRPEKLGHGLGLVAEQAEALTAAGRGTSASVLVVDNDPGASARSTVATWQNRSVRYVCEPVPGIAAARNRALDEAAEDDLLVFIDDDEWAEPGWLSALVDTWEATGAAAVMGRVVSRFEHEVPPFVEAGRFFVRRRLVTGTPIPVAAAGNLLLDMQQVRDAGVRFDESLGLGGGEDTLFTRQLVQQGRSMVWCDESVAVDFVPPDRLTRQWVLMRAWSHGLNTARFDVLLADGSLARCVAAARAVAAGTVRVGGGALRWGWGLVSRDLVHQARGLRALHRGRGMVAGALGRQFEEYARDGDS